MDSPLVDNHSLELAGNTRLKDYLAQALGHAAAIVDDVDGTGDPLRSRRDPDGRGSGITSISKQLHDNVLYGTDVVSRLSAFCFGYLETDVSGAEILFNFEEIAAGYTRYKINEILIVVLHWHDPLSS